MENKRAPIYHNLKRFFQIVGLRLIKFMNRSTEEKLSEYEQDCISICQNLIKKEKSKLLMSPISRKRYIKSEDNQIFIIIDSLQVTIVNHNYSYTISLTIKGFERIVKRFDNEVERRRQMMEDEIRSNVKHSLSNINKNIINEQV